MTISQDELKAQLTAAASADPPFPDHRFAGRGIVICAGGARLFTCAWVAIGLLRPAGIIDTDYVLCVGTLEVRKNPTYLFNVWKMMVQSARSNIPYLVFVGRKGWLVQDFMDQLTACNYLGGRILVVHDATDVELDLLYRKCMLTMFPSFAEGWGLPVGESLAHGKICLCSAVGGIPEVGKELADYTDPYNAGDALQQLLRYIDDPEVLRAREREIADQSSLAPGKRLRTTYWDQLKCWHARYDHSRALRPYNCRQNAIFRSPTMLRRF